MADTDKKYIPEGVFLVCDQGGAPTQLICDPHPINLYGVRYADENDNKPQLNIPSFGTCKTMGKCQPPVGLEWTKLKEDVRLHGARPLLEDSECTCWIGSGVIKIYFDQYAAEQAAEDNNESSFVKDSLSSSVLGMVASPALGLLSPKLRDGIGRGLKKGLEGSYNFVTDDMWKGETWVGLGKVGVIAAAYASPTSFLTGDATLRSLDNKFGTDFTQTRDALVSGVEKSAGNAWENVKRGNWGEVGEDIGQVIYAGVEAVAGSKGAGLVAKGAKTAGTMAVGAQRLAQIAARSQRALQVLKSGVRGVVKVGRRVDDVPTRRIPGNGISIEDRIRTGGNPPDFVRQNPDRYYYDPDTGRYKVRPEAAPDLSAGSGQRAIPCFPKGTLIETVGGLRPIETIRVGALIKSFDETTQIISTKLVSAVHQNRAKSLVKIGVKEKAGAILCTKQHRFWVQDKSQWVQAQFLDKGMLLKDSTHGDLEICEVSLSGVEEQETYNLTVEDSHTYFVSALRVLVHNEGEIPTGKIYIGYDPQGNPIYVGQTRQDIDVRQSQHRTQGAQDPDNYGWKRDMTIRQVEGMDGLTDDQMDYHERRIYDQLRAEGRGLRNNQIPMTDEKINELVRRHCR